MFLRTDIPVDLWAKIPVDDLLARKDFFYEYGKEINVTPDQRFIALTMALKSYYETYRPAQNNTGEGGYASVPAVYNSIIYMGLFLELYIRSHFNAIDPERGIDKSGRSKKYSTILKQTKNWISDGTANSTALVLFKDYFWTLGLISELRNELIHRCDRVPFIKFIDVIYVNHLSPLLVQILEHSQHNLPKFEFDAIDRKPFCDVQVLLEISKMKLIDEDFRIYNSPRNRKLNHLKALGKAAMSSPLFYSSNPASHTHSKLINEPIQEFWEQRATRELDDPNFLDLYICPCCGTRSLLTAGWLADSFGVHPGRANCMTCKYLIDYSIGEPMEFGIMEYKIFNSIPIDRWKKMRNVKEYMEFLNATKENHNDKAE